MACGMIQMVNTESIAPGKIRVSFLFYPGNTYDFREHTSLRLYWRSNPEINSVNESIDVTPQNAKIYEEMPRYIMPGWYRVVYEITGLSANTPYAIRVHLRLFKKPGSANIVSVAKTPVTGPVVVTTKDYTRAHPLFEIATYPSDTGSSLTGSKLTKFIDFTKYIVVPTYDVNSTDINEDWTDADYVTHRIVVREKVTGTFDIRFSSVKEYNDFMDILYQNRVVNGKGYTELRVQVNNKLDYDTGLPANQVSCMQYIGKFFVKMDNNPYAEPYYGHYDKYNEVTITIEEA